MPMNPPRRKKTCVSCSNIDITMSQLARRPQEVIPQQKKLKPDVLSSIKLNHSAKLREEALRRRKEMEEQQRKEKEEEARLDIRQRDTERRKLLALQNKSKKHQRELQRLKSIKNCKAQTVGHGGCNYGPLVKEAIVLLDKFTAGNKSFNHFMYDAEKYLQDMDAVHRKFILDVVSGSYDHRYLLEVIVNDFYIQAGGTPSILDLNQFVIICYIAAFVLEDIGLQCFRDIVKYLDIKDVHMFLNFFLTALTTGLKEEWDQVTSAACVEEQWIGPLMRWLPDIDIFMDQPSPKMSCGTLVKKAPNKTSKAPEVCLTKPEHRQLPMTKLTPQQIKSKQVPVRSSKEMQIMKQIKLKKLRSIYLTKQS